MKIPNLIIAAFAISILAACGSLGSLEEKVSKINLGDTKETVLAIMGPPGDRQFNGKDEAWQYVGRTGGVFYQDFRVIWFYDGKVTGTTSSYSPDPAAPHFKPVRWEDAPSHK